MVVRTSADLADRVNRTFEKLDQRRTVLRAQISAAALADDDAIWDLRQSLNLVQKLQEKTSAVSRATKRGVDADKEQNLNADLDRIDRSYEELIGSRPGGPAAGAPGRLSVAGRGQA